MTRTTLLLGGLMLWLAAAVSADETGLLRDGRWIERLRPERPRLFFAPDDLPALRAAAAGRLREETAALKREVDALPDDAPMRFRTDLYEELPDGSIKVSPGRQGVTLFVWNGSDQAVRAALLYLITGESGYAAKAANYLRLFNRVLAWTAAKGVWADLTGHTRINALAAVDWIWPELTPETRRELLLPLLDYIADAQPSGRFRFRRTIGSASDGNYGEPALEYFAGLAAAGAGVDDARAEAMLRRGAALFVEMMDRREAISGGSGLLSSLAVNYSFYNYPYATFHFLHTWRSAFGEEVCGRWKQMCDYPVWFDWAAIRLDREGRFFYHGFGDLEHRDNRMNAWEMYTHLAQTIHFYGKKFPEQAAIARAALRKLPPRRRRLSDRYPFLPWLLRDFDPSLIDREPGKEPDFGRYFHAASAGLLLMRSGKGDADTYAGFRFGSQMVNHQHYDELGFVIYKHDFLALDGGSRTESDHHHNFAPQSVAHNTILIHQEHEPMAPFWTAWSYRPDGRTWYNHGGQYDRTRGRAVALQSTGDFIYAAGDATACYRPEKCREATRQFVYLKPDFFVIYDRVESLKPEQKKEILLHTQNQPEALDGNAFRIDRGRGRLFARILLPRQPQVETVGGPGREFEASGRNWELPGGADWARTMRQTGRWRLEISDPAGGVRNRFLQVLQAADTDTPAMIRTDCASDGTNDTAILYLPSGDRWELAFRRTGALGLRVRRIAPDGTVRFDADLPNRIEPRP